ncbi:MAG: formate dehydrogenase subunit gamma [Deltaproteobacteria bacterium]|nr:formate dehydrogenase subunit gamma [Deltaproteobacteria bacterium]MBW2482660.1 formate dehydrogenase subunit gamma [Deltaproteobacteria bacterium]
MTATAIQGNFKISGNRQPRAILRKTLLMLLISTVVLVILGWIIHAGLYAAADAQKEVTNPRANFWRAVRDGQVGVTTVQGQEQDVLIQNGGENWRRIRNGLVAGISPWLLGVVFFVIMLFFILHGPDKLEEAPSGETLDRWSLPHRLLHWYTALLFILMGLTGLSMLFGRAVLIPALGHSAFAGYMSVAIKIHNYGGPLFLAGLLIEIIAWFKPNIPKKIDLDWFKSLGGMLGKGPRPHAEKINAGSKGWFWFMVLAGLTVGITGLILDFPEFGQLRWLMQVAHVIHASIAVVFITGSLGHIYLGSIGAQGTFESMWRGKVSVQWAKQHNDLWYAELIKAESAKSGPS